MTYNVFKLDNKPKTTTHTGTANMSKTYSTKSNAVRAARNAGLTDYTITTVDGRFAVVTLAPKAIRRISEVPRPCNLVADICRANPGASRKDLLILCDKAGVALNTARTQVSIHRIR